MQELRWRCHDAYHAEQEFLWNLELAVYEQQKALCTGSQTNLYAIADRDAIKLGVAEQPIHRFKNVQVSNPRELILYAACPATLMLEKFFHKALAEWRVRGEWFAISDPVLAVCDVLLGCQQMCSDMVATGCGPVDGSDTIEILLWRVREFVEKKAA